MRTVIIGNSGSGKTWLAARLAEGSTAVVTHLDDIFWNPGGFDEPRPAEAVDSLIGQRLHSQQWVVEGVFGALAEKFLPTARTLVWLDMPWEVCSSRLRLRGAESTLHMTRLQSEEGLRRLMVWAKAYYSRSSSRVGHERLYATFTGKKLRLISEGEVADYLACCRRESSPASAA